jgi:hypothetical protein
VHGWWRHCCRDLNLVRSSAFGCNVVVFRESSSKKIMNTVVHGFALRVLQGTYGAKSHFVTIFFPVGAILFLRRVSVQFCNTTDVKAFPSPHSLTPRSISVKTDGTAFASPHPTYPREFSM